MPKGKPDYRNRNILVMGFARSGIAAARLLTGEGAYVSVYDSHKVSIPGDITENIGDIYGSGEDIPIRDFDKVVVSPGISPDNPVIKSALNLDIPVIAELELGLEFLPEVTLVAVTGTNGKTTTCELISYMTGAIMAGNMGRPLTSVAKDIGRGRILVLEVSSYQIYFSPSLKPHVGVLLNIFPEHIAWHGSFENYVESKRRMFLKMLPGDYCICNRNIDKLNNILDGIKAEEILFSVKRDQESRIFADGEAVYFRGGDSEEKLMDLKYNPLRGSHNLENILAALGAWKVLGTEGLPDIKWFKLPAHRMEPAGDFGGASFINDSKATNMDSVLRAVETYDGPIVLLMGGRSKGQPHPGLKDAVTGKVSTLIAFGESRDEIESLFGDCVNLVKTEGLREAVREAFRYIGPGFTVLLSPGGSSFDEFSDFEERGERFKKWVEEEAALRKKTR